MKLTIELVPAGSWGHNLRSILTKKGWDLVRYKCYQAAGNVCEICAGVGPRHPVECHEIWEYDDTNKVQKLTGFLSLCPMCHRVKHIGHAISVGLGPSTVKHLAQVNGLTTTQAWDYVHERAAVWQERSRHNWTVDISFVDDYLKEP
jgi:hypothetical protein